MIVTFLDIFILFNLYLEQIEQYINNLLGTTRLAIENDIMNEDGGGPMPMDMEEEWAKQDRRRKLTAHYHIATSKVVPGIANEALITELQDIALSFEQLIGEGLPGFADVNQVRYKIAHCKERIAFIYTMWGKLRQAKNYYEEARQQFAEIGNTMMVETCQESLRSLLMRGEGNVDEEIQHLYAALEYTPSGSLDHVELLTDLGTLLVTAGDNFAAKEYLHTAERELEDLRYLFPSAEELQIHYQQAMRELSTEESSQWIQFQQVASLYRRIYQALIRIYERTAPERVKKYSERIELLNRDGFDPFTYEQHLREIAGLVQAFEAKVLRREAEEDIRQKEQRQKDIRHQKEFNSTLEQMNQAIEQESSVRLWRQG